MSTPPSDVSPTEFAQPSFRGGGIMRGLLPSLVINAVAPFVLYQTLISHHVKAAPALAATAIFPVLGVG